MVDLTRQSFYLARVVKTRWLCPRIKTTGAYQTPLKAPTCLTPSTTPQISLGLPNETSVGKVPKRIPTPILLGRNSLILRVSSIWFDQPPRVGSNQPTNLNFIARWSSLRSPNNLTTIRLASLDKWYLLWSRPQKKTPTQSVPVLPRLHGNVDGIWWDRVNANVGSG